jgi:hypothetical protein
MDGWKRLRPRRHSARSIRCRAQKLLRRRRHAPAKLARQSLRCRKGASAARYRDLHRAASFRWHRSGFYTVVASQRGRRRYDGIKPLQHGERPNGIKVVVAGRVIARRILPDETAVRPIPVRAIWSRSAGATMVAERMPGKRWRTKRRRMKAAPCVSRGRGVGRSKHQSERGNGTHHDN